MRKRFYIMLAIGPLILMLLLAFTPGISFTEDLGRHLLLGRIIVEQLSVPDTNLLTYTHPDFPFINHHWLSEVVFCLLHKAFSLNGLIVIKMIIMTATLALVLLAVRPGDAGKSAYLRVYAVLSFAGILSAVILGYRSHIRPELFTYFNIALFLFVFEQIRLAGTERVKWYLRASLTVVMLFWANLHIYFLFGIGMIGAFVIEQFLVHRDRATVRNNAVWVVVSVLVCLINPNGVKGFLYPLRILSNYGLNITENVSPLECWQTVLDPMLIALPILSLMVVASVSLQVFVWIKRVRNKEKSEEQGRGLRELRLGNLIIVTAAFVLSWHMARSTPLLALCALPVIAGWLGLADVTTSLSRPGKWVWAIAGVLVVAFNIWLIGGVLDGWYCRCFPSPLGPTPLGFDNEARFQRLSRIKSIYQLKGPVFTDYNIGSLAEYEIYPEKGYVDNRPEAFPVTFWKNEYIPALALGREWQLLCQKRGFNYIVVSLWGVKEFFVQDLVKNPVWQLIHLDEICAVFVKNSPENLDVLERNSFDEKRLQDYVRKISEDILALPDVPWWRRQTMLDSIAFRLYSLICINQHGKAWPYIYQLHKLYPDYQILHELIRVTVPPNKVREIEPLFEKNARWPVAAKQVLDWGNQLLSKGKVDEAQKVFERGLWFFPLSKELRECASRAENSAMTGKK